MSGERDNLRVDWTDRNGNWCTLQASGSIEATVAKCAEFMAEQPKGSGRFVRVTDISDGEKVVWESGKRENAS